MTATTSFLGFNFASGDATVIMAKIVARARGAYGYVITPNVDFVTRAASDENVARLYAGAAMQICDSRVLGLLARAKRVSLDCYPGSDLVADLLAAPAGCAIAVIGPSAEDWAQLTARFPDASLSFIASSIMTAGDPAWQAAVQESFSTPWDIMLICLGSPKQERFAADLAAAGRSRGVALCVGASIDFLTGRQSRAPGWIRSLRLEWLHRLAVDPKRLWRRYLVDGPKILWLVIGGTPAGRARQNDQ